MKKPEEGSSRREVLKKIAASSIVILTGGKMKADTFKTRPVPDAGLVMELLNSKVDHPDYICDRTW